MVIYQIVYKYLSGDNEQGRIYASKENALFDAKLDYKYLKNDEDFFSVDVYKMVDEDGIFRTIEKIYMSWCNYEGDVL